MPRPETGVGSTLDRPMDTTPTPSDGPMLDSETPGETSEPVVAPPVVAVVVTKDPGPWLEESLAALGASDYPALTALVLDAGSTVDPTARVGRACCPAPSSAGSPRPRASPPRPTT